MSKSEYNQSLKNQIVDREINSMREKLTKNKEIEQQILREKELKEKEEANRAEYNKKLKAEFLLKNKELIDNKKKKENLEKKKEFYELKDMVQKDKIIFNKQLYKEKDKKVVMKSNINENLGFQIKEKKELEAKIAKKEASNTTSDLFSSINSCQHDKNGICSICKNSYPIKLLNPKKNYKNFLKI